MPTSGLDELNTMPDGDARQRLHSVCSSSAWVDAMATHRPFDAADDLYAAADDAVSALDETDLDEALAGHPRIGERSDSDSSRREQAGVTDETRDALTQGNAAYEQRFGHVYLVSASGRSGDELLAVLRHRLTNDAGNERRVAREELGKINRLRLQRLVEGT